MCRVSQRGEGIDDADSIEGGAMPGRDDRHIGCLQIPQDLRRPPILLPGALPMLAPIEIRELPSSGLRLVRIDCPDCRQGRPARVLIWDEDGQSAMVCCLGCEAFIPAEDVVWWVE
jgi:hypothetical protein